MVYYKAFETRNFPGTVVYQKPAVSKPKSQPAILPYTPAYTPRPTAKPAPAFTTTSLVSKTRMPEPLKMTPMPKEKASPLPDPYQVAVEQLQAGQADEALVKLYEKLDQDADFVPAYYVLGKIYANKGNLEEAQNWCERAIKKDKLHPEPYYTLSMIYQQHGLLDMAIDALKKAVYLDREFVLAHYNLAQIYRRQGDKAAARKSLLNVQRLLQDKSKEELVPEGDGLVAGRLLELVENELADPE